MDQAAVSPRMLLTWLVILMLSTRVSWGAEEVTKEKDKPDKGPSLHAAKAITKKIEADYADLEPPKLRPDKTHFEYNVSFYADAGHFEEEPKGLEKELNEIIKNLDDWVTSLKEPNFSVKLNYKLKVFAPKDPDRIDYNFKGSQLFARDVWDIMKKNKLVVNDTAQIIYLLVPYTNDQAVFSGSSINPDGEIRGVASPMEFRELGLGLSQVYTRKWIKETTILKKSSGGYKWKNEKWLCLARKTCTMRITGGGDIPDPPDAPKYNFENEVMQEAVKAGNDTSPTMELLDAHIAQNLSWHQKTWIGVTAHEIGHLLGAPERGVIHTRDDAKMMWDVMLNPVAGTRYGDTSKYAIFLNIACELRLKDNVFTPSLNIDSRDCQVPGGEASYYRRYPAMYSHQVGNGSSLAGTSNRRMPSGRDSMGGQPSGRDSMGGQPSGRDSMGGQPSGVSGQMPMNSGFDNNRRMPMGRGSDNSWQMIPMNSGGDDGQPMPMVSRSTGNMRAMPMNHAFANGMAGNDRQMFGRSGSSLAMPPMVSHGSAPGSAMDQWDNSGPGRPRQLPMFSMDSFDGQPMDGRGGGGGGGGGRFQGRVYEEPPKMRDDNFQSAPSNNHLLRGGGSDYSDDAGDDAGDDVSDDVSGAGSLPAVATSARGTAKAKPAPQVTGGKGKRRGKGKGLGKRRGGSLAGGQKYIIKLEDNDGKGQFFLGSLA